MWFNLLSFASCIVHMVVSTSESAIEKLVSYGYNSEKDDGSDAILKFQEYYQLPLDGELNSDTLDLLNQPRCGVHDTHFKSSSQKWNKNIIKWYYSNVNEEISNLAELAFQTWSSHTNLKFEKDILHPDIIISNKRGLHQCQRDQNMCSNKFDGKGGILAHAKFPNANNSPLEIHIDLDEDWYYNKDKNIPPGKNIYFPFYFMKLDIH